MTSTIAWRLAVRRPPAPTRRATISSTVMGPPSAAALTGPAVLVWSCAPLLRFGARSLTHLLELGQGDGAGQTGEVGIGGRRPASESPTEPNTQVGRAATGGGHQ